MINHGRDPGTKPQVDDALDLIDEKCAVESLVEDTDPASYRDLTKAEALEGVADGVRDFLAGDFRPADECYDELGWQLSDDET